MDCWRVHGGQLDLRLDWYRALSLDGEPRDGLGETDEENG